MKDWMKDWGGSDVVHSNTGPTDHHEKKEERPNGK